MVIVSPPSVSFAFTANHTAAPLQTAVSRGFEVIAGAPGVVVVALTATENKIKQNAIKPDK